MNLSVTAASHLRQVVRSYRVRDIHMKQTVSAILISTDNEFILQQRDDKPDIARPGMITNFGGSVEGTEKPIDAIIREIQEELCVRLNKEDLILLTSSVRTSSLGNEEHLAHVFIARNIKKEDLHLREGKAIIYLGVNEPLDSRNLSSGTRDVLLKFKNGALETRRENMQG